jgi:hypothetical protein
LSSDKFEKVNESKRLMDKLNLYTGMSPDDIRNDLAEKQQILDWMINSDIYDINSVGDIISQYYTDKESLLKKIRKKK